MLTGTARLSPGWQSPVLGQEQAMWDGPDFGGAKIALIFGSSLVTYLRDDKPGIPFPNMWDLPGGGREGNESPVACALREVEEEFGIRLDPAGVLSINRCAPRTAGALGSYFLVAPISSAAIADIRFGSEGQRWALMGIEGFMAHPGAIPQLKARLRSCLDDVPNWHAAADKKDRQSEASTMRSAGPERRAGLHVRPAQVEDAVAACAVIRRSIEDLCHADHGHEAAVLDRWLANKTPENVAAWIARPDSSVLVAILDGRLASVGAVTDAGEITLNYVAPDARFQGMSRAMLAALETRARERGNRRCHLLSTETAHRFYAANGYRVDGPPQGKFGTHGSHPMSKDLLA